MPAAMSNEAARALLGYNGLAFYNYGLSNKTWDLPHVREGTHSMW